MCAHYALLALNTETSSALINRYRIKIWWGNFILKYLSLKETGHNFFSAAIFSFPCLLWSTCYKQFLSLHAFLEACGGRDRNKSIAREQRWANLFSFIALIWSSVHSTLALRRQEEAMLQALPAILTLIGFSLSVRRKGKKIWE